MRNVLIVIASIIGLALVGVGIWRFVGHRTDPAYDQLEASGALSGPARDQFIADFLGSCAKAPLANVSMDTLRQFCTCAGGKMADLVTPEEGTAMKQTGAVPASLTAKMQGPIKECAKSVGLKPAQ